MSDRETYQQIVEIKKHIKVFDDLYNLEGKDKGQWHRGKPLYRADDAEKLRKKIGYLADWVVQHNYGEYCAALRAARQSLRSEKKGSSSGTRLQEVIAQGRNMAALVVNQMHSSMSFSVFNSRYPAFERKTSYFGDHSLGIPAGWHYSVYDRGIASVRGGDGPRFIMSAKPRTSPQLDNELYEVVALKRDVGKQLFLEDGWVAKADNITAYATDFKKAQNLLNRRVRAKIMEAFVND